MFRRVRLGAALLAFLFLGGCGAAYYGAVLAVLLLSKKTKTIDTSFPDAQATDPAVPGFATVVISSATVTVQRTTAAVTSNGTSLVTLTDFAIARVDFPAGYGEAQSNRDASTNLVNGDRILIRVNGDAARALAFTGTAPVGSDLFTGGSLVAAAITSRVRALAPIDPKVPATAYSRFQGSFDVTTGSYTFRSGEPGEPSSVELEPVKRTTDVDLSDDASKATARRLGLGIAQGGIEVAGASTVAFTLLNRGTDSIPSGATIELWLSHDKVLDPKSDLLFDVVTTNETVAVGEARRFYRRNGSAPPQTLLRQDLTPGKYYVLFNVKTAGNERVTDNNLLVSSHPIEVYQPVDDPATQTAETASALDFALTATASPISAVTGGSFGASITIGNFGAAVGVQTAIDVDVSLSLDHVFDEPAAFQDPAGVLAGVHMNPTDPFHPITVRIVESGSGALTATFSNDVATVTYNPTSTGPDVAPVASLVKALNNLPGTPLDVFTDGAGDPSVDRLKSLLDAAKATSRVARDLFLTKKQVLFAPVDRPLGTQSYTLLDLIRPTALKASVLPLKLIPFVRIRPPATFGDGPENTRNNVREAANYVRVYDRNKARFDSRTGAFLPTVNADDFAILDAVSQRPVNTGAIRSGQQRVFAFDLPTTGLTNDVSQLLVIARAAAFDAHIDLLSSAGNFLAGGDDTGLGLGAPIVYTTVLANQASRTFYLVLSSAREDDGDLSGSGTTFSLTISVNQQQPGDVGAVGAVDVGNVLHGIKQRYETADPRTENRVLVPFSMASAKSELVLVLPRRARVRFRSKPLFQDATRVVVTQFLDGGVPTPLEFQAELDPVFQQIIFRPQGGDVNSYHLLEEGVYTISFTETLPDPQKLRLEIDTEFLPPATTTTGP